MTLPAGHTIDDLLTVEEFAKWIGVGERWVRDRLMILPGVIQESREVIFIHPRTYIESRAKKGKQ